MIALNALKFQCAQRDSLSELLPSEKVCYNQSNGESLRETLISSEKFTLHLPPPPSPSPTAAPRSRAALTPPNSPACNLSLVGIKCKLLTKRQLLSVCVLVIQC